jgi:23S rRNA (guanosine2251-2'-O)-methyltransferase
VRKVASGAAETTPFIQVTNLARTLRVLRDRGVWLYGTDGNAVQSLYSCTLTGSIGFVMGAEGTGMRHLTREQCDFLISLPMAGSVSSLNVAVAAGICLYETLRQNLG